MTVMSIPLSQVLFNQCQSLLPFGKTLGIVLPGFVMWVLGVVFKVPFTNMTGVGVLIAYAVFNVAIYKAANKGQKICFKMVTDGLKKYAKYEIIFYVIFLFWVYLIGFNPSAYGTEKFMDYGFCRKCWFHQSFLPMTYGLPESLLITITVDSIMQHLLQKQ